MRRFIKKAVSYSLVVMLAFTSADYSNLVKFSSSVSATSTPSKFSDDHIVNEEVIPDTELIIALNNIIGGGNTITFKQLRDYSGVIDLSKYVKIQDITGLGYARNATEIDMDELDKVKSIADNEFEMCVFSKIQLPCNLEKIGASAFYQCTNLETIDIPETVTRIYAKAFNVCKKLDNVELPSGLVKLGNYAFDGCESLTSIVIPDGINAVNEENTETGSGNDNIDGIGINVFNNCRSLSSAVIGKGMTVIPAGFLKGTESLKSIDIPEKIISIRSSAFDASGITSIDLSKNTSMTTISSYCFHGSDLMEVKLPSSIETIERSSFLGCSLYNSSDIFDDTEKLKFIGLDAFKGCSFQHLNLPGSIETIDMSAFEGCTQLREIVFENPVGQIESEKKLAIGESAFAGCINLSEIIWPDNNLTNDNYNITIGTKAFARDCNIENFKGTYNITYIGQQAFSDCATNIKRIVSNKSRTGYILPENIHDTKEIDAELEAQGEEMQEVWLYSNDNSSYYLPSKKYVYFSQISSKLVDGQLRIVFSDEVNGIDKNYIYKQEVGGLKTLDLSECTRTEYGTNVFSGCFNLKEISLPDSTKKIPEGMFSGCATDNYTGNWSTVKSLNKANDDYYYGLEKIDLPSQLDEVGKSAFQNCYKLDLENKLPNRLKTIGASAFLNCKEIKKITFPSSIVYIGNSAFEGCSRIWNSIMLDGYGFSSCDVSLMSKLEYLGTNAFASCNFESFIMDTRAPLKVVYAGAFKNCQRLKNVRMSNNVELIKDTAMSNCFRMETIQVADKCTLGQKILFGYMSFNIDNEAYISDFNRYVYKSDAQGKTVYLGPKKVSVMVEVSEENQSVLENNTAVLPFYSTPDESNCNLKQVKIAGSTFEFNSSTGEFEGDEGDLPISPEVLKEYSHSIEKTDYAGAETTKVIAVQLNGKKTSTDVSVAVESEIAFFIEEETGGVVQMVTPVHADYSVDVQANPCVEIDVDDKVYVNKALNAKKVITPTFIANDQSTDMTDLVDWKVITGSEFITLIPSEDGKSATVKSTNTDYGVSQIQVKAGTKTKNIYVYNVVSAGGVKIDKTSCNMALNTNETLSATLTYGSDADAEMINQYPDHVAYTSSDSDIVEVRETTTVDGKTVCTLFAKSVGAATITATTIANGSNKATCKVYVSSENIKMLVTKSSDDSAVDDGSEVELVGKKGSVFKYAFNEELANLKLSYTIMDETIADVTYDTWNKTFTITGKNRGRTDVTIYPQIGSETDNGITLHVNVEANIRTITLTKKSIPMNTSDNILTSLTNDFRTEADSVKEAKKISSNTLVFESSDTSIATVDSNGNVKVIRYPADGSKVTITCKAMNGDEVVATETTTVTPTKQLASSIQVPGEVKMTVGELKKVNVSIMPTNCQYRGVDIFVDEKYSDIVYVNYKGDTQIINIRGKHIGKAIVNVKLNITDKISINRQIVVVVTERPVILSKTKKVKVSASAKKKVTISWGEVEYATGYQIQMSKKKKSGYKTIKTIKEPTTLRYVKKKLKSKKTYYFRVRAFAKTSSGAKFYGKWSTPKKKKVK